MVAYVVIAGLPPSCRIFRIKSSGHRSASITRGNSSAAAESAGNRHLLKPAAVDTSAMRVAAYPLSAKIWR
ncbi:MAG: hypothetical protein DSY90_00435 [Deltaproteobacteria bacterium]|nr:MAG: hypothetical protein DSY90_00435 [Deltaproteobacteria bacterium]